MERRDHLPMLDGVRFACAVAVLAYHLLTVFPLAASSVVGDFAPRLALPAGFAGRAWWGWVGVDLFFVVSGYVIAASAVRTDRATFVRRRALRLLPAAWLCGSLTALVLLAGSSVPAAAIGARWATSLLLFPLGQPIDEIYWTLGVEVAFYALVALGLGGRGGEGARLVRLGAGLAAASLLFWVGRFGGVVALDPADTLVRLSLLPHGGFFAVGIALQALAGARGGRAARFALFAGLIAGAGEIVALAGTMRGVAGFTADPLVPLAVFAGGVAAIALAPRVRLSAAAGRRCALLGAMTYPLYLLNQRFLAGVLVALVEAGVPAGWAMALAAALVVLLAWAIAARAEPALRGWLARRLSPRRATPTDTLRSAFPRAG